MSRNKTAWPSLCIFAGAGFACSFFTGQYAQAQYTDPDLEELDRIVIDQDGPVSEVGEEEETVKTIWEKYFYGQAGADFTQGFKEEAVKQRTAFLRIGGKYPVTNWLRLYAEGRVRYFNTSYEVDLKEETRRGNASVDNLPASREFETSDTKFELNRLRADIDIGKYARLRVGRQQVVWGQMSIFSPIDNILPQRLDATAIVSKVERHVPQDVISASVFPNDWLEATAYGFVTTNIGSFRKSVIDNRPPEVRIDPSTTDSELRAGTRPDSDDIFSEQQYAGRIILRPGRATLGLTFYSGRNTLTYLDYRKFEGRGDRPGDGGMETAYDFSSKPNFAETTLFGAELSFPVTSKVTFRAEAAWYRQDVDLDVRTGIEGAPGRNRFADGYSNLVNWIRDENNNEAYVKQNLLIVGAGVDIELERWRMNLYAFHPSISYGDKAQRAIDLQEAVNGESDDPFGEVPIFPAVNVAYNLWPSRNIWVGAAAGLISFGAGGGVYARGEFFESLRWVASVEQVESFNQLFLSDGDDPQDNYDDPESGLSVRLGVTYSF